MPVDEKKQYLGDGVYVKFDGYHAVLKTEQHGIPALGIESETNTICLDSTTALNLIDYLEQIFGFADKCTES